MRDFYVTLAWLVTCLALVFLFQGSPDLWDKLHAQAMQAVSD